MSFAAARNRVPLALALVGAAILAAPPPAAATSEFVSLAQVARAQLGDRFRIGTEGPDTFDCSGLVYFVFKRAGLLDRVGGQRRLARGYLRWFRDRGLASTQNPKPGDLVIWGDAKHIGIYVGDGKAISALINPYGVRVHPVKGYLNVRFKTYLHVSVTR